MTYSVSPICLLSFLYFLQGLPYGLQARFLPIYFRAHGMSLSNIGFIKVLFFPWMCKTLWAPLVDRHGNKKTWLWWSMLGLGATCVVAAGIQPSWLLSLCIILLIFNFLTSTQDIATDGLAIEILTSSQVASGNIAQVVGYKFGAIMGGGLLAWLSDHISWGTIFIFLTLIYAAAAMVVKLCVPNSSFHFTEVTLEVPDPMSSEHRPFTGNLNNYVEESFRSDSQTEPDTPSMNTRSKERHVTCSTSLMHKSMKDSPSEDSFSHGTECFDVQAQSTVDLNQLPVRKKESKGLWWLKDHFATVLTAEGTVWILVYVLVYKLGKCQKLISSDLSTCRMPHSLSKTILQGTLEVGQHRSRQRKCRMDKMKSEHPRPCENCSKGPPAKKTER